MNGSQIRVLVLGLDFVLMSLFRITTYRFFIPVLVVFVLGFISERTTLRLLYAISRPSVVCCLSVCDVGAPYSGG